MPTELSLTMSSLLFTTFFVSAFFYFTIAFGGIYNDEFILILDYLVANMAFPLMWWLQCYQFFEMSLPLQTSKEGVNCANYFNIILILIVNGIPASAIAFTYVDKFYNVWAYVWLSIAVFIEAIVYYIVSIVALCKTKSKLRNGQLAISPQCVTADQISTILMIKITILVLVVFGVFILPVPIAWIRLVLEGINFMIHIRIAVTRNLPGVQAPLMIGHHGHQNVPQVYLQTPQVYAQPGQQPIMHVQINQAPPNSYNAYNAYNEPQENQQPYAQPQPFYQQQQPNPYAQT